MIVNSAASWLPLRRVVLEMRQAQWAAAVGGDPWAWDGFVAYSLERHVDARLQREPRAGWFVRWWWKLSRWALPEGWPMTEAEFREAVRLMRKAQKAYFAERRQEDLNLSRDWERRVDWELKKDTQKPDLFGPKESDGKA